MNKQSEEIIKDFKERFSNGFINYEYFEPEDQEMFDEDIAKFFKKIIDQAIKNERERVIEDRDREIEKKS